jgi:hypothetical protein
MTMPTAMAATATPMPTKMPTREPPPPGWT